MARSVNSFRSLRSPGSFGSLGSSAASLRGSALLVAALFGTTACEDEFPLGSWGQLATSTASTVPPPVTIVPPACGDVGVPGAVNPVTPNAMVGTTNLNTDWTWPTPLDSLEWDLVIESDPARDGYYWAHKFAFDGGQPGVFGLQAHGGYVPEPPTGPPAFTKMALLWIAGPPAMAELGDIPVSRISPESGGGLQWLTIHGIYEWTACHVYHLRFAKDAMADADNAWYGAWILDRTTGVESLLGRMLIPVSWGQFNRLSTMYTTRIDNAPGPTVVSCSVPEAASAIFGIPTANDGQIAPVGRPYNWFPKVGRCPTSRFTELETGVRHEIGLPPSAVPPAP